MLSLYDEINNKFIVICLLEDISNNISNTITENLSKNLITFYPKNYDIPLSIKPDYLFKPLEIWELEFEDIIDSDIFLTNYNININDIYSNDQTNLNETRCENFYIGKTLKFVRFIGKKPNLDINVVTTLSSFKNIYAEYIKENLNHEN